MTISRGMAQSTGFQERTHALGVHRTGKATVDHMEERSRQIQAVKVMHKHGAMDLLEMMFGPILSGEPE